MPKILSVKRLSFNSGALLVKLMISVAFLKLMNGNFGAREKNTDLREKCQRNEEDARARERERERYGIGTHGNSSESDARQRKREHFTISRMRRESRRICAIFSASSGLKKLTLFMRQTCRVARKERLSFYSYRARTRVQLRRVPAILQ